MVFLNLDSESLPFHHLLIIVWVCAAPEVGVERIQPCGSSSQAWWTPASRCVLSVPMRLTFPLLLAELALTCLCLHYAASSYMKYRWVQRSFPMNGFVKKYLATQRCDSSLIKQVSDLNGLRSVQNKWVIFLRNCDVALVPV